MSPSSKRVIGDLLLGFTVRQLDSNEKADESIPKEKGSTTLLSEQAESSDSTRIMSMPSMMDELVILLCRVIATSSSDKPTNEGVTDRLLAILVLGDKWYG
jgi:hypothetical protein